MPIEERVISTVIQKQDEHKRLDNWLTNRFTYHSRNQWQNHIKNGIILVNDNKSRSSKKLQIGDSVSFIPEFNEPTVDCNYTIEFEDNYFILINKPPNLPCHPAGRFFKNTLWYLLSEKYEKIAFVNRLDRETSGLLIVCKNSEATAKFANLFALGQIQKKYYVLVHGDFYTKYHAKGYLINDENSEVRKKRKFVEANIENIKNAEFSETKFDKLKTSAKFLSLLNVELKTGRMHQIRSTLFSLGFPVVGDKLYGLDDSFYIKFANDKLTDNDWAKLILKHQALHAYSLSFKHPYTNKIMSFEIPMPKDMQLVK